MAQEPRREDNRPPRFGGRPPGSGDDPNQAPKKGPRFSIYWIYAIIAVVLIGANFFSMSPDASTTTELEFRQQMLAAGDAGRSCQLLSEYAA